MATLTSQIFTVLESNYPEPMHYRDITQELIDSGAWPSLPKTPTNTVSNRLTHEINTNGELARFVRVGPKGTGIYRANPLYVSTEAVFRGQEVVTYGPLAKVGRWISQKVLKAN